MRENLFTAMLVAWMLLLGCAQNASNRGSANSMASRGAQAIGGLKNASTAVQHFWFDYRSPPDPGRRVWVHVDDSTWAELYPNGNQSRYKTGDRVTVQGITGTTVRKVAGDPNQTWTLNDGSFEVFIPDRDSPRLILAFRHYQNGRWTEWQPLAFIQPIE